jgi:hypothetical protein
MRTPSPPRTSLRGPEKGAIAFPANAGGHRVFVDEHIIGTAGAGTFALDCGMHTIRIGHDGRDQRVDVPCNGRVLVAFP